MSSYVVRPVWPAALALALAVAFGAGAGKSAAGPRGTPVFVPDNSAAGAPPLVGRAFDIDGGSYRLRLERLDVAQRRAFLKSATGSATDPFAARPDQRESFLTFLLELENRGADELVLHPQNCWLITRNKNIEYPLNLDTIRSSYHLLEQPMPAAYEKAGRALLGTDLILGAGEKASGLLVYRYPHPRLKRFAVELQVALPTGEVARFRAPYRRAKE